MEGFQIAFLVLAALVVGALLPLLVQLYSVLHTLKHVLEKTSKDIEDGARVVHKVADRVDRLTADLEKDGKLDTMVAGVAAVSDMALQLRDTIRVASAVGAAVVPAVGAAVRAWRADGPDHPAAASRESPGAAAGADPIEQPVKEVAR